MRLHVFADTQRLGRAVARRLGVGCATIDVHRFPDGESLVRTRLPPGDHAVVVRSMHPPNDKVIEVVLAADALRRAGARRVTLLAPYLPYMRQDAVFVPGEPLSQQVIGKWLGETFDSVVTVEAHLHRIRTLREAIPTRARSLAAAPVLSPWLRRHDGDVVVVGPDEESTPWIRAIARAAGLPFVVGTKERLGDRHVRVTLPPLPPRRRRAVIIDDIASSGETIARTARLLRQAGCATIDVVVVHPIFAAGAVERIRAAGVRHLVSCDTIVHPTNAIAVAPLLATALGRSLKRA